ncbi:multiple monosaccharide ABC transporter permease [Aquiluna sp. KACHI24]|uniref:multiple monosaccharide ABC transporter permease n=1 Tax=Aquiluna sp. KACHI24 TaxID=2968831 RepID=UPI00220FCB98|nr:multiple monosaccharide ABC transporter permease [Aquiluna sp. KACHI24]BDQ00978.1 ABC transporter permease [Aquiluna sp. KACHI24]
MSNTATKSNSLMDNLRQRMRGVNLRQNGIFLALIGLVMFFAATTPNAASLTPTNWSNLVVQNGYILVLAIGMVMVIIAGHIDLSVGSVAAFIGAVAGILVVRPLEQDGWEWLPALPWWAGILGAILVGAIVGVWQGFWVAYVGIPAFIVTLAGMLLFRGMALLTLQNSNIGPFPDEFRAIGNGFLDKEQGLNQLVGFPSDYNLTALVVTGLGVLALWVAALRQRSGKIRYGQVVEPRVWFYIKNTILTLMVAYVGFQLSQANGIPFTLILLIFLVVIYTMVMNRTPFGRYIYAIGGNLNAAVLSGINVRMVNFWLFVNMGALAALSGVLIAARMNSAVPKAGDGFELDAISSVFIGGAAVQGGVGTVTGSMVGGLIQGVLANGMNLNSVGIDVQMTIKGLVLLLAVAFDVWSKRRK